MAIEPMKIKELTIGTDPATAYTFPSVDGAASEVLTTDGAGNLSFAAAGGGLPTGVLTNALLRWDGANWVETSLAGTFPYVTIDIDGRMRFKPSSSTEFYIDTLNNEIYIQNGLGRVAYIESAFSSSTNQLSLRTGYISSTRRAQVMLSLDSTSVGTAKVGGETVNNTSAFILSNKSYNDTSMTTRIKCWATMGSNIMYLAWQSASGYWLNWAANQDLTIAATTNNISDAVYSKLGTSTIGQFDSTGSYSSYEFDVNYHNTTDNTWEKLKISLVHDGTTIADTDYGYLGTTAAREIQYTTRYNAGDLEIGLWSASTGKNVTFTFNCTAGVTLA